MERLHESSSAMRGRIAVAALPSIVCTAMPAALKEFARANPGIAVALHDVQHERAMTIGQLERKMR
jgi:LysR family carnitine catabolism transcriptional activator